MMLACERMDAGRGASSCLLPLPASTDPGVLTCRRIRPERSSAMYYPECDSSEP
jgi:hypothetical protein